MVDVVECWGVIVYCGFWCGWDVCDVGCGRWY